MNMNNLAQKYEDSQGELVSFPKKERQAMSDKKEGFTPMPNFISDEGYLAAMNGETFKCLYLLNRHIGGFHVNNKSMGEEFLKLISGIKDNRTIRKATAQLEKFGLIKIEKNNGKRHSYTLTYDERLPIKPVASDVLGTSDAVTCDATTPVASNVPTTSDMACHPVKEIDLKENIKEKVVVDTRVKISDFQPQNRPVDFVEYHTEDRAPISLKNLCEKYTAQKDFVEQAKLIFPDYDQKQIDNVLSELMQWSLSAINKTPQKWMNTWLKFLKQNPAKAHFEKPFKSKPTARAVPLFGSNNRRTEKTVSPVTIDTKALEVSND